MTEAEKAAKSGREHFWFSIVMIVIAGVIYFLSLQFQPPPTVLGSQRSGMKVAFGCGALAWFEMMTAYRKQLSARRAESEAFKA
ncbi:MAG TPA: hypothetical protein VKU80_17845 [Planctomycetota bacterium]|nr:hypothetical protein [Planctomycetota bacterium]